MKNKILIFLCLFGLKGFSQITILGVDTFMKTGPISQRINLVFMGDGYASNEMTQFVTNAQALTNYLFNSPPFSNYKNYFNVFFIKTPSPQSGVSHPGTATDVNEPASPVLAVTNNFNTRFDNWGVHRSIYSMNAAPIYSVLAAAFPAYDQVVILGNSPEYGGTGGAYAVSSIHPSSNETVVHEMGHSFAGLADEYWAGIAYTAEKPNMTAASFTSPVKWAPWVGTSSTGIYPYDVVSPGNQWFKPHQNCKMQFLGSPFCPVCKQAIIEKIHSITNPIDAYFPDNVSPVTNSQWFKAKLVKPSPNTLKRTWVLNSGTIASNKDSILIPDNLFFEGTNNLLLNVTDTTKMSRDTDHVNLHTYSVYWTIEYSSVGIKKIRPQLEFSVFPNPASDFVNLNYTLPESSELAISINDMNGRTVMSENPVRSAAGDYSRRLSVSAYKEGSYVLSLKINNQIITTKFIITR